MKTDKNKRKPESGRVGRNYSGFNVQQMTRTEKKDLGPLLQRMLPRRANGIEKSGYYRQFRIELLPRNPFFMRDVSNLRGVFNIPIRKMAGIDLRSFPNRKSPWDNIGLLNLDDAAGFWLEIHRQHFMGNPIGDWVPPLPKWFLDSSHTMPVFGEKAQIGWLQKEPSIPERFTKQFDLIVPLDRCVARLIERYQLPWLCKINLQRYIVTGRKEYLRSISPFDVEIDDVTTSIGEAFTVTIDGIDEFMTKLRWAEIFDRYVKPRQGLLWERRGELPHPRQKDIYVLMRPWAFKVYNYIYKERTAGRTCAVDRAIEFLSIQEKLPQDGLDRSNVFRAVKNLNILFQPSN